MAGKVAAEKRPVIRAEQIKVISGAPPKFAEKLSPANRFAAVYQAILQMPPGSHLVIPGTEGRRGKQLMGPLGALTRWKNKNIRDPRVEGVTWGELEAGGVGVYRAKALASDPPAGGGAARATPIPSGNGRPDFRRRSEDM